MSSFKKECSSCSPTNGGDQFSLIRIVSFVLVGDTNCPKIRIAGNVQRGNQFYQSYVIKIPAKTVFGVLWMNNGCSYVLSNFSRF